MRNVMWSRSDKLALLGLVIAIISCLAAVIVVPEIRHWLGLQSSEATGNGSSKTEGDRSKNSNNLRQGDKDTRTENKDTTNTSLNVEADDFDKIAGIGINGLNDVPKVHAEIILENTEYTYRVLRVQLLDMALYRNRKLYIKVSVCNVSNIKEN